MSLSKFLIYSALSEVASFVGAISRSRHAFPVGAVSNRTYRQTLENTQFSPASSIVYLPYRLGKVGLEGWSGEDWKISFHVILNPPIRKTPNFEPV